MQKGADWRRGIVSDSGPRGPGLAVRCGLEQVTVPQLHLADSMTEMCHGGEHVDAGG